MAEKKFELSSYEAEYIKDRESEMRSTFDILKRLNQFKVGDHCIAYQTRWGQRDLVTNSYGATNKYVVVAIDEFGVPYMKLLNKHGQPQGQLLSPINSNGEGMWDRSGYDFEIDPDYADSIIMDDEANYDPTGLQREKSNLFKEITAHNKSSKVRLHDEGELLAFLKTLKVGDVFWKSIKTNMTITQLDPVPTKRNGKVVDTVTWFGSATLSSGKVVKLNAWSFYRGSLYTKQPRSYNELKDPK